MENKYKELLTALKQGLPCVMLTRIQRNQEQVTILKEVWTEDVVGSLKPEDSRELAMACLKTGIPRTRNEEDGSELLAEAFFPEERLIILGGGHVSQPLASFAADAGFSVVVVDDRPSFASQSRFPKAKKVLCESFERCFDRLKITKEDYVVIVTRGHKHDLDCLKNAISLEPKYVGMIGSRRRVSLVRDGLLGEGYDPELVAAVHSPIGLNIGAVTPGEIAVSILAQIICVKRLGVAIPPQEIRKVDPKDMDFQVLEKLSEPENEKRAVLTVVSTKGSTPRHAGAKMLAYEDGRIIGSIGGGCSEAEILKSARDMIREGGAKHFKIDMTGSYAEEEGMVCGGIMDVLVEIL